MKINFSSLFVTPLDKYRFFFIFGNDSSIFSRATLYIEQKLSASITTKSEGHILETTQTPPSLFSDHASSKKIILVPNVTDKIIKKIESMNDGIYIFSSDKARAKSKLVTYFSQNPHSLAISFYDSPISTSEFEFLVHGRNIPDEMKGLLLKAYQNDYMGLCSALNKIQLFGEISEDQYEQFLSPSDTNIDNTSIIHGFLLKDIKMVSSNLFLYNPANIILLLRSMSRSFQSLYALLPYKNQPSMISWNRISPAVFFKEQNMYVEALKRWNAKEIQNILNELLTLEYQFKFSTVPLSKVYQSLSRFCS